METHEKMDSLLLSTLIARIELLKLSFDDVESPLHTFMSLMSGPTAPSPPPVFTKNTLATEQIATLFARFGNNNFSIHSHFNTYAHGIFPLASRLFNHSCMPNAAAKYIITPGDPPRMEIVALRPISEGEEICLPYIDPALLQTRRTVFQLTYGFTCRCPSCIFLDAIGEIPEPPTDEVELQKLSKSLQEFVKVHKDRLPLVTGDAKSFPNTLRGVLHESYLASLSERFSNAAHDGSYEVAMEAGATLTALYRLVYPPNYPQIGLHLLELAKTLWNAAVSTDSHDEELMRQVRAVLSEAENILVMVLGISTQDKDKENMPSFLPTLSRPQLQDRRSFHRLRSLHLNGNASAQPEAPQKHNTKVLSIAANKANKKSALSIAVPRIDPEAIPPVFWLGLLVLASITFVFALASTFRGSQLAEPYFKHILDDVAGNNPGIVLVGENVDVDVDEPSITFRWSMLACGSDYVLPNSTGIHGSDSCGLPGIPLEIYVDGEDKPVATFDPTEIPFNRIDGKRRNIQSLSQFDSDHVLDVHQAYLFPFDTYKLSSSIRAVSNANQTIPIRKLATIDTTSSFSIITSDVESYSNLNSTQVSSRDIDLQVRRPAGARAITLFLFAISWFLTHICMGNVYMASKAKKIDVVKKAFYCGVIIAVIPQLRNSMPDAPGLDGVLIDSIGYFPQMLVSGLCLVILMVIAVTRELNEAKMQPLLPPPSPTTLKSNFPKPRPPRIPSPQMSDRDSVVVNYNMYRIAKHLKGEFVFPPVNQDPFEDPVKSNAAQYAHRRLKTTVGVL
ncbi:hypothetical protein V5O48_011929 [Marasmius crinis-equi]|uniref:SET domain-containing protein n=1 Tax=Marasmius crinis-equi TaxID=585013 RepID=A0ABR3F487_9AGAR